MTLRKNLKRKLKKEEYKKMVNSPLEDSSSSDSSNSNSSNQREEQSQDQKNQKIEITPEIQKNELPGQNITQSPNLNQTAAGTGTGTISSQPLPDWITPDYCGNFYGAALEIAHGMYASRKNAPHRGIPEERRVQQGKLLYDICRRYGIQIPAEMDILIFGGSIIADWQYMSSTEGRKPVPEINIKKSEQIQKQEQEDEL